MATTRHYVVVGGGMAGNRAAAVLRQSDPDSRVTLITAGSLLFYNRYELPRVFHGQHDWRAYLVHPPAYYEKNRITVRRNSVITQVDSERRVLVLGHREEVSYDRLLVATGGRGYLPAGLRDCRHLVHRFDSFEAAVTLSRALPEDGKVVMLGGDIMGLHLARTLIATGHQVTLVPSQQIFWPHQVAPEERAVYLAALERKGVKVTEQGRVEHIEEGAKDMPARRVLLDDGGEVDGDVVMAFYGLVPVVEFMVGSGVDIERGLLVNPQLHTTNEDIWAAGDVCQIWSAEENSYRFYYGWKNVKAMGEIAARNMTGDQVPFTRFLDEKLSIDRDGAIVSPFWEHD